jgi:uncharacterized protein YcfL
MSTMITKLRRGARGLLLAAALVAGGCATSGMIAGDSSYTSSPYLLVDDPVLASQVSITGVDHTPVGDLVQATVTLKSNRHRSLHVQYRFSWYDEAGREIDPGGKPYRDLILEGKDAVPVSSVAPSPAAKEFKIRVRKLKSLKINNLN